MTIGFEVIASLTRQAVHSLLSELPDCLDGTERTVTGRLAIYLDRGLTLLTDADGYVVDIEYERAGRDVKRLHADRRLGKKIVPDLLLHRRGFYGGDENLLVMEVKPRRAVGPAEREHDRSKLSVLTGEAHTVFTGARKYLRLTPVEGDLPISLPQAIVTYRFGAWVQILQDGAAIEWFGDIPNRSHRSEWLSRPSI